MTSLDTCLGLVAPLYNLILVLIIIPIFLQLILKDNKKKWIKPWKVLSLAFLIYILEEVLTVLNSIGFISTPRVLTSFFELIIISLFIYMLLLQKELIKK